MATQFNFYYELNDSLEKDTTQIRSPVLYDFPVQNQYLNFLDRLSRPLPGGQPSPFSSRNPLSADGQKASIYLNYLQLLGHEINLLPDKALFDHFRMLGLARDESEYAVIELELKRSPQLIADNTSAYTYAGLTFPSRFRDGLSVIVLDAIEISGLNETGTVQARLNQQGDLAKTIRTNEFVVSPDLKSYWESVTYTGAVINPGRNLETAQQIRERAQRLIQRPGGRCVTYRDFYSLVIDDVGADKAALFPELRWIGDGDSFEYLDNFLTIAVYPSSLVSSVAQVVSTQAIAGMRWEAVGGRVIPIDGTITVRVDPQLLDSQVRQLAAQAIVDYLNPPKGKWGDLEFAKNVAIAVERAEGIYAVPSVQLKHSQTDVALDELTIRPWDLLEIQNSVIFEILKT